MGIGNMLPFYCFLLLAFSISLCKCEICGECICTDDVAVCYVNTCESVIVKSPQVEIIRIYGQLCSKQILQLRDLFFHNTIVELMDSSCIEEINNCR